MVRGFVKYGSAACIRARAREWGIVEFEGVYLEFREGRPEGRIQ